MNPPMLAVALICSLTFANWSDAVEIIDLPSELASTQTSMEFVNTPAPLVLEAFGRHTGYRVFFTESFLGFARPVTISTYDLSVGDAPADPGQVLRAVVFNALREMRQDMEHQFQLEPELLSKHEIYIEVTHHGKDILIDARIRRIPEPESVPKSTADAVPGKSP